MTITYETRQPTNEQQCGRPSRLLRARRTHRGLHRYRGPDRGRPDSMAVRGQSPVCAEFRAAGFRSHGHRDPRRRRHLREGAAVCRIRLEDTRRHRRRVDGGVPPSRPRIRASEDGAFHGLRQFGMRQRGRSIAAPTARSISTCRFSTRWSARWAPAEISLSPMS